MVGASHIRIRCVDGVTRLGWITGKMKKKVWIREGGLLIVVPRSFQDGSATSSTAPPAPRWSG